MHRAQLRRNKGIRPLALSLSVGLVLTSLLACQNTAPIPAASESDPIVARGTEAPRAPEQIAARNRPRPIDSNTGRFCTLSPVRDGRALDPCSGLVVDSGLVLTARTAIWGADEVRITTSDDRTLISREVATEDPRGGLAVLRFDSEALPATPLALSTPNPKVGSTIFMQFQSGVPKALAEGLILKYAWDPFVGRLGGITFPGSARDLGTPAWTAGGDFVGLVIGGGIADSREHSIAFADARTIDRLVTRARDSRAGRPMPHWPDARPPISTMRTIQRARDLIANGDTLRGSDYVIAATNEVPECEFLRYWACNRLIMSKRTEEARKLIKAWDRPESSSLYSNLLAITYAVDQDYARAASCFEQSINDQESVAALVSLANVYERLNRVDDAVRRARRALELDPEERSMLRLLFRAAMASQRVDEATAAAEQLVALDQTTSAALDLAHARLASGDAVSAQALFASCIDDPPSGANRFAYSVATLCDKYSHIAVASHVLRQLSDREPENEYLRVTLAGALTRQSEWEQANAVYRSLFDSGAYRREATRLSAHCLVMLGRYDEAEQLAAGMKDDPEGSVAIAEAIASAKQSSSVFRGALRTPAEKDPVKKKE